MTTVMLCVSSYLFPFVRSHGGSRGRRRGVEEFSSGKGLSSSVARCCPSGVWGGIDVGGRRRRKGRRAEEAAREEEREKKKGEDPYSVPFGALLLSFLDALLKRGGGGGERPIIRVFPFSLFFLSFCFSSKLVGIFPPLSSASGGTEEGGGLLLHCLFALSFSQEIFFCRKREAYNCCSTVFYCIFCCSIGVLSQST